MKAILYNPQKKTTSIEDIQEFEDYYKLLNCGTFTVVTLDNGMDIYCDDEGLFVKDNIITQIEGYPQPLAGNLLFLGGCDEEGETIGLEENISIVQIENMLSYYGKV